MLLHCRVLQSRLVQKSSLNGLTTQARSARTGAIVGWVGRGSEAAGRLLGGLIHAMFLYAEPLQLVTQACWEEIQARDTSLTTH